MMLVQMILLSSCRAIEKGPLLSANAKAEVKIELFIANN